MSSSPNPYQTPASDIGQAQVAEFAEVKFFSFSGRLGRLRYLAYGMAGYLVGLLLLLASMIATGLAKQPPALLNLVFAVLYVLFVVSLAVRRSHDMNLSGWSIVLMIIPLVGLFWLFAAGTQGANRFGLPPPPNPVGVKLLAWFFPVFVVLMGILAAIAIPAYQDYTNRVRAHTLQK